MKLVLAILLLSLPHLVKGQGTFNYDQQSSTEDSIFDAGSEIQSHQPIGQSFTPSLSSVGFVRFFLFGNGGTMHVLLRQGSLTGTIVGSTSPVTLLPSTEFVNFFFPSEVVVSPGSLYFFQPIIEDGGPFTLMKGPYNYAGGAAYVSGQPDAFNDDFWFREGIIVPEPSCTFLLPFGLGVFAFVRFRFKRKRNARSSAGVAGATKLTSELGCRLF